MALAFDIKLKDVTGGAYGSVTPRSIQNSQALTFDALAIDDGSPSMVPPLIPINVTELDVLNAKQLNGDREFPEVNVTVFRHLSTDFKVRVQPWMICMNLRADRNLERNELWRVVAEFSSGNRLQLTQDDLELIPAPPTGTQAAVVGAYPFIVETLWTGEDRILFEENNSVPPGPTKRLQLPTGSLYSEPFYGKFPKRGLRQSQFEVFADEAAVNAAIELRLFSVQGTSFGGDTFIPPRWMITEIDYQHVELPDANLNVYDAWLMTYTLERSSLPGGWYDRRALIDNYYLDPNSTPPNKRTPARDDIDQQTIITIKLNLDGTKKADQTTDPLYEDYIVQPPLDWSFLK